MVDLKTARSRWSAEQVHDSAEQLLLYSELARQLAPEKKVVCRFIVVTKAKTPVVEQHTVSVDPQRIDRTKAVVECVWRAILAGHFFPTPSPITCSSCPYRKPCQAWPDIPSTTTDCAGPTSFGPTSVGHMATKSTLTSTGQRPRGCVKRHDCQPLVSAERHPLIVPVGAQREGEAGSIRALPLR